MIKTWIADVSPLTKADTYQKYYKLATEVRRKKADQMMHINDKALSLGVWSLYEKVRKSLEIPSQAIYNFSHAGHYALCSIAENEMPDVKVGCDLELVKELRLGVAKRFFCPAEYAYIKGQLSKEAQTEEFFRYWVLKESFLKATREGMKLPMDTFEIQLTRGVAPQLIRQPKEMKESYYYQEYEAEDSLQGTMYKVAVCATTTNIAKELIWQEL
ncbi:MAG: 4'-phosphopantetheinyl transferase superfamily protein [Lachnospiraceae bacterium]